MANAVPLRFAALLTFLLSAQAAQVESTRDPNRLAHELFAPSANVVTVNASVSGPANAIGIFSGADKDVNTGSKSGIVLSTGDAKLVESSRRARSDVPYLNATSGQGEGENGARADTRPPTEKPGDGQLTQLTGGKSSDGASLSFQFQTTADTKSLRINFAFVTQESASRIQQGFDDVFAIFIDGELAEYVRASEAKEAPEKENGARGGPRRTGTRPTSEKNLCVITQSKLIELSSEKVHSIKLAIADVGDNNGDSFAFISITGSDDRPPFIASPLVALLPPPDDLTSTKGPPKTTPPTTTPPPPVSPPVTALSGPKRFEVPPPDPKYAPPVPPYIASAPPTVSVPDHANSMILLAVGMLFLFLLRHFSLRKSLSF